MDSHLLQSYRGTMISCAALHFCCLEGHLRPLLAPLSSARVFVGYFLPGRREPTSDYVGGTPQVHVCSRGAWRTGAVFRWTVL